MPDVALAKSAASAMAQALADVLNGGTVEFYSGTQPATADTAVAGQPLLGALTIAATSGTVSDGVLTFAAIAQDQQADAAGLATWTRWKRANGVSVIDLAVGTSGSGKPVEMTNQQVYANGPIQIQTAKITVG